MKAPFFLVLFMFAFSAHAADSLSYSGRLVNTDGSPVSGPVSLRFELAYTSDTTSILCFKDMTTVPLTNGVFHTKLEFDCTAAGTDLKTVLHKTPPTHSAAIRVIHGTKVYSFQALHSMPFALVSEMANTLGPLTATDNGKVLQWDGTSWIPATVGTGNGTVTSITAGTGLSGGTITDTGTIAIAAGGVTSTELADGSVTDAKVSATAAIARLKLAAGTLNHVLVNDGTTGAMTSVPYISVAQGGTGANTAAGARTNLGLGSAAVANIGYATGNVMPGDNVPICITGQKLHFTGIGPTWWSCIAEDGGDATKLPLAGGTMVGSIDMGTNKITNLPAPSLNSDAATKAYVDSQIASESLWTESGADIHRATGYVGIGTTTPSRRLHVSWASGDLIPTAEIGSSNLSNNQIALIAKSYSERAVVASSETASAIEGFSNTGTGLYGSSTSQIGVRGVSSSNIGVQGESGSATSSHAGVVGSNSSSGTGVLGLASTGAGVRAESTSGFGIWAIASSGTAIRANSGTGASAHFQTSNTTGSNVSPTVKIVGGTSQTSNLLEWQDPTNTRIGAIDPSGKLAIGNMAPTALIQLKAGTADAHTAPIKLTAGTNLTTPEAGAIEYDGTNLYYTDGTNTRRALATSSGGNFTEVSSITGSGALPISAGGTNQNLTLSGSGTGVVSSSSPFVVTSTTSSTSSTTGAVTVSGGMGVSENINAGGTIKTSSSFIGPLGSAAAPTYTFEGDLNTGVFSPGADLWGISTAGAERLRVDTAGNVGIGTTAPQEKLQVRDGNISFNTASLTSPGLLWNASDNSLRHSITAVTQSLGVNTDELKIYNRFGFTSIYGGGAERMRIDSVGNVGIGTTSPSGKLHTEDTLLNQFSCPAGYTMGDYDADTVADDCRAIGIVANANGRVGIGTTTPNRNLHVAGSMYIERSGTPHFEIVQSSAAVNEKKWRMAANANGNFSIVPYLDDNSNVGAALQIDHKGKIGINQPTPSAWLQLPAGAAGAALAPLKLTAGTNLTTPEPGAFEFDGTNLFYTDSTGVRRTLASDTGTSSFTNVSSISGPGAISIAAGGTNQNVTLAASGTGSVISSSPMSVTSTTSSTSPTTGAMIVSGGMGVAENINAGGSIKSGSTFIAPLGTPAAPSYTFDGDLDTGVFSPGADLWGISTGGLERLRVNNAGNVGIGTTTPHSKLHVEPTNDGVEVVRFTGKGSSGTVQGSTYIGLTPWEGTGVFPHTWIGVLEDNTSSYAGSLIFSTRSAASDTAPVERMRISSSGNVGIGTTVPSHPLHVKNASTAETALVVGNSSTGAATICVDGVGGDCTGMDYLYLRHNNDVSADIMTSVNGGKLNLGTLNTKRLTIDTTGNVGIGTTAPEYKLDVNGDLRVTGSFVRGSGTHITALPWFNAASAPAGYVKLVTPIVYNEANMFLIKIRGYSYSYGGGSGAWEAQCAAYACTAASCGTDGLYAKRCHVEGTDLPVEIDQELRGSSTVAVIRIGTPTFNQWYYQHFTAEYTGWKGKSPSDFQWVLGETTPAQTGNYNNVVVNDQAGKVSIGTTAPLAPLHVKSPDHFLSVIERDTASAGAGISMGFAQKNSAAASYIFSEIMGVAEDVTAGSEDGGLVFSVRKDGVRKDPVRITGSGNVGIGTGAPFSLLDIRGTPDTGRPHLSLGNATATSAAASSKLLLAGHGIEHGGIFWTPVSAGTGKMQFSSGGSGDPSANSVHMTIQNNGFVGIGTTAPSQKLSVEGNTIIGKSGDGTLLSGGPANHITVKDTAEGGSAGLRFEVEEGTNNLRSWIALSDTSKAVEFSGTYSTGGAANWAFLAGNVGIGTTSPEERLHISNGNIKLGLSADLGSRDIIYGRDVTGAAISGYIKTVNAGVSTQKIEFRGDFTNILNSSVGIGTTAPTEKLEVVGNVKGTSFITSSDRRLKDNIKVVSGLPLIMQLKGVTWDWKADGVKDMGLIAQNVEEVFPHAVITDPKTGMKGVKYNALIAPLIEASKDLAKEDQKINRKIASLEEENQELKKSNVELKNKNEQMEKMLFELSRRLEKLEESKQ